jgi:TonB-linked SusC/RagA family outer membrane protein
MDLNLHSKYGRDNRYALNKLLLVMKLILILLTTAIMQVSANSFAQKITLNKTRASLGQVINEIRKQSGYDFLYNNKLLTLAKPVTIHVRDASIEQVLAICFDDQPLTYAIDENFIVLKRAIVKASVQVPIDIKGRVTDEKGGPLPGASINIKGTTISVSSDANGEFTIRNVQPNAVLVVSFLSFVTQEISIGSNTSINVVLLENTKGLDEVVVVGYGTQQKANISGAIAVIDEKMLSNRPSTNTLSALQGAATGMTVQRTTGEPGAEGYSIQIRGLSSVNGSRPLVVVDGTPSTGNSLDLINPNDIASISVLKDAAASAIYGARAAGGVILVTTKKGQVGGVKVDYNSIFSINKPINLLQPLHSWEQAEMEVESRVNAGLNPGISDEDIARMKDPAVEYLPNPAGTSKWLYYYDVDPIPVFMKDFTGQQNHNLSVSGGSEKDTYFLSVGYMNEDGILKVGADNSNRMNARLNYDHKFGKIFSLDSRIDYTRKKTLKSIRENGGAAANLTDIYTARTKFPTFVPETDGIYYSRVGAILGDEGSKDGVSSDDLGAIFNLKATNIVPGLNLSGIYRGSISGLARNRNYRRLEFSDPVLIYQPTNQVTKDMSTDRASNIQFLADYNLKLAKHDIKLLGGYSFEDFRSENLQTTAKNLSSNEVFSNNLGDPTQASNTDNIQTWALLSYFGRLNYNFDSRYLLEFTMRYDGSSKLAPENRWQLFPSVSAAWRLENESWFKESLPFVNQFKIRGSWGQLGNSDGVIGNYDYIGLLSAGPAYPFANTRSRSYYQASLASPAKTWETVQTSNIGTDLAFLKGRLTLSGDYYNKRNKDMLVPVGISSAIGITTSTYNLADMKTWGWEVSAGWNDVSGKLSYWANVRVSDDQNKILKYASRSGVLPGVNNIIEGMPYGSIFGYISEGFFQQGEVIADHAFQDSRTGTGDYKYKDVNGDNIISAGLSRTDDHGDLVYLGNAQPRYSFGADFGFTWKGIDFSAFIQGVGKRSIYLTPTAIFPFSGSGRMPLTFNLDYWTPENTDARFPRLYLGGAQNWLPSSDLVMNSAYVRLKNLQFGYTLPGKLTERAGIGKLRVYFTGQDLLEFNKMWLKEYDPESPNQAAFQYPYFRSYALGINVTF